MIISVNSEPNRQEFDLLLSSGTNELNLHAKNSPKVEKLVGKSLEPFIKDVMADLAKGTVFENSIELISGQRFPDIVAKNYYGVEVKTTTKNHWKTVGNSILESTRVESVERIFMMFAKLAKPVEFRCRPYEDVLSDVVVTHSPRYLVDMNLKKGNTIFDKIEMPYDTLRNKQNPIKPIVEYYKSQLKQGDELWWIDNDNSDKASGFVIRIWSNLPIKEKYELRNKGMAYFPELFGSNLDKFGKFAIWLTTVKAVVCPNIRDLYTAGGKGTFIINGITYKNIPRILMTLFENFVPVCEAIALTPATELSEFWGISTNEKNKLTDWIILVTKYATKIHDAKHLDIEKMLTNLIYG